MPPKPRPLRQPTEFDLAQEGRILAKYEDYIGAVAHKAWAKYGYVFRLDEEDFRQEGRLNLLLALRSLDWKNYNAKEIDNFIKKRLWGSMIDFIRSLDGSRATQWRRHGLSVDVILGVESDLMDGHPLLAVEYPVIEMLGLVEEINRMLWGISGERDRRIVLLAIQGHDNVQIARMINGNGGKRITPSRISQILGASGLFRYTDKDSGGKRRRIKDGVGRSTEYNRRKATREG